jgi:hypothetical protein
MKKKHDSKMRLRVAWGIRLRSMLYGFFVAIYPIYHAFHQQQQFYPQVVFGLILIFVGLDQLIFGVSFHVKLKKQTLLRAMFGPSMLYQSPSNYVFQTGWKVRLWAIVSVLIGLWLLIAKPTVSSINETFANMF